MKMDPKGYYLYWTNQSKVRQSICFYSFAFFGFIKSMETVGGRQESWEDMQETPWDGFEPASLFHYKLT